MSDTSRYSEGDQRPTYDIAGYYQGARFSEQGARLIELSAVLNSDWERWESEVPPYDYESEG